MIPKRAVKKAALCILIAAAILAAAALVRAVILENRRMELVLTDNDSGAELARYDVKRGDVFSITFIHSVNKTPVTDYYEVRDGDFYVTATKYYSFGAGVQTEIEDEQTLTYTDDGGMLVSGFNRKMTGMIYVVGMVSDHMLEIGGEEISLRNLCGRGTAVCFTIE